MAFVKKFLVLKEITPGFSVNGRGVNGIARAESESGITSINLSLINFAAVSEGEYYALTVYGDSRFTENLGSSPFSASYEYGGEMPKSGFACLIAHASEGKLTPVAAGICAETGLTETALLGILNEKFKESEKVKKAPAVKADMAYATETYDDETVATENYYLADDADAENLKIKEENYERELHTDDFGADAESAAEKFREEKEEKVPENEERFAFFENDENYYLKVKAELDGIFETNPPEPALEKTLPESKWARINYGTDKYYVVGLVYEKNAPKFICYGVPAAYSEYPPKELAGYCSFIPLSVFEMRGNGFWMMFQDAKTGECVHMR